jgi:uncharacterized protein (TIGR02598 family)
LIEVVLALGITAMGITSILGLLPQSLEQLKKATDVTAETRINQQIISAIGQAGWQDASGADALSYNYNGRRWYFDSMAQEITQQKLAESGTCQDLSYVAEVRIDAAGFSLPGGSTDPNLRRVSIKVKNSRVPSVDFDNEAGGGWRRYSTLITRTGR